jgi:hypothetical protein
MAFLSKYRQIVDPKLGLIIKSLGHHYGITLGRLQLMTRWANGELAGTFLLITVKRLPAAAYHGRPDLGIAVCLYRLSDACLGLSDAYPRSLIFFCQ